MSVRNGWRVVLPGLMVAVGVATFINSLLLFPALGKIGRQAEDGQQAKQTQCLRDPVSQKLALAAYAVRGSLPPESRITPEELAAFKRTSPKGCPKLKP